MNIIQVSYHEVFTKPWLWSGKFYDFHSDEELTEFVATLAASGTAAVLDTAGSAHYGVARLSGAATTDNSGANIHQDAETIALVTGKTTLFTARFQLNETTSTNGATESDFFAGIALQDTAWFSGEPTDGIYFRKNEGDAYLDCVVVRDDVEVGLSLAVATLATGTWYTLEIVVDMEATAGAGTAYFYLNGTLVGTLYSATMPYSAEEGLAMTAEFITGDNTGTKWCDVDYIGAWVQR